MLLNRIRDISGGLLFGFALLLTLNYYGFGQKGGKADRGGNERHDRSQSHDRGRANNNKENRGQRSYDKIQQSAQTEYRRPQHQRRSTEVYTQQQTQTRQHSGEGQRKQARRESRIYQQHNSDNQNRQQRSDQIYQQQRNSNNENRWKRAQQRDSDNQNRKQRSAQIYLQQRNSEIENRPVRLAQIDRQRRNSENEYRRQRAAQIQGYSTNEYRKQRSTHIDQRRRANRDGDDSRDFYRITRERDRGRSDRKERKYDGRERRMPPAWASVWDGTGNERSHYVHRRNSDRRKDVQKAWKKELKRAEKYDRSDDRYRRRERQRFNWSFPEIVQNYYDIGPSYTYREPRFYRQSYVYRQPYVYRHPYTYSQSYVYQQPYGYQRSYEYPQPYYYENQAGFRGSSFYEQILGTVIISIFGERLGLNDQIFAPQQYAYGNNSAYHDYYEPQRYTYGSDNGYYDFYEDQNEYAYYQNAPVNYGGYMADDNYGYQSVGYDPDYYNGIGSSLGGLISIIPFGDKLDRYTGGLASALISQALNYGYERGVLAGQSAQYNGFNDENYYDPYAYDQNGYDGYSTLLDQNRQLLSDGYEQGFQDALSGGDIYQPESSGDVDLVGLLLNGALGMLNI
ncbi:MAG: hypothetical protein WBD22_03010 [Pyrinomonadaceae bacterium]